MGEVDVRERRAARVRRAGAVALSLSLVAVVGCSDDDGATDEVPADCEVAHVRVEFGTDVRMDRVNSVFDSASELDGVRSVQRAEELGDPPAIRITAADGSARSVVDEVERLAGGDAESVTAACRD